MTCLVITIITLSYLIINNRQFKSNIPFIDSSLASPSGINPIDCRLSMAESDGWFCEFDSDWKRRKNIHHMQNKRNRISNESYFFFFQNHWEPTIQCKFAQRVGNTGDGGKWVCDIHRFLEMKNKNLLIYSLGCSNDFGFERGIKEQLPKAEIHTFDTEPYECPVDLCTFHQAHLDDGKKNGTKSLQMIINELGHQKREIHILKVDIEGSEYSLFQELFNSSTKTQVDIPYIRQILFESYLGSEKTKEPCRRVDELFELLYSNNYAIFHKEANLHDGPNVQEYALLRLNPAFFVSPL